MERFTPLLRWLQRGSNSEVLIYKGKSQPNFELGGFVTLDKPLPVYKSQEIAAESLETSWNNFNKYMSDAMELLDLPIEEMVCLDNYEIDILREELGEGPSTAYPIYIITTRNKDKSEERVVYIGKNSASTQRFKGGHSALTKLHNPKYDNLEKNIYLANVILLTDEHYLPLEWIQDLSYASKILNKIESHLIYHFQPELNTNLKTKKISTYDFSFHIQNFNDTGFLNDEFI